MEHQPTQTLTQTGQVASKNRQHLASYQRLKAAEVAVYDAGMPHLGLAGMSGPTHLLMPNMLDAAKRGWRCLFRLCSQPSALDQTSLRGMAGSEAHTSDLDAARAISPGQE